MEYFNYILLNPQKPGNYVYSDLILDHEPFYVGKGCKRRPFEHYKEYNLKLDLNCSKRDLIRELNSKGLDPLVIKMNHSENEIEVLNAEIELIKRIGQVSFKKGPLLNSNVGGEGNKVRLIRDSTRKKLSDNNRWKGIKGKDNPLSKTIYQYSLSGDFLQSWENASRIGEAMNVNPGNIRSCCLNKIQTAEGYHWSYTYKGLKIKFNPPKKVKKGRPIICYNDSILLEFDSIQHAVEHFQLKSTSIFHDVITGRRKQFRGFKIEYNNENRIS